MRVLLLKFFFQTELLSFFLFFVTFAIWEQNMDLCSFINYRGWKVWVIFHNFPTLTTLSKIEKLLCPRKVNWRGFSVHLFRRNIYFLFFFWKFFWRGKKFHSRVFLLQNSPTFNNKFYLADQLNFSEGDFSFQSFSFSNLMTILLLVVVPHA